METRLYLVHHGIKDMKWGVRRYRNKDGTLTEAGKKRYRKDSELGYRDETGALTKDGLARTSITSNQGSKVVSGSQTIGRGVRGIYDTLNPEVKNRYNKRKNLTQEEMNRMSDDDLRNLINRINMEQQYSQLTKEREAVNKVRVGLDIADSLLSVGGGALTVWAAWRLISNN